MLKTFGIAVAFAFAFSASGCGMMSGMMRGGGSAAAPDYMSGSAPVTSDPAGSATNGTGSVSWTGDDQRVAKSTGEGGG